ncbi:hypothetical protein TNCV_3080111 [Trichonephila clavipes]|nr:hypothetical protein TNCV_3080111 [Trichonephila clavipes]
MRSMRQRSYYRQFTEHKQDRIIVLSKGLNSFHDLAERLGRNVSTVHDCCQQWSQKALSEENRGPSTHGSTLTMKSAVFFTKPWINIRHLQQILWLLLVPE